MPVLPTSSLRDPISSRILVVDDESLIRWSLCTGLHTAGFDAVCARSAEEARRVASNWPPPRVAIVDLAHDGEARELMGEISHIYPACRFVLMTTANRHVPHEHGDNVEVIEKPFDLPRVVSLIKHLLEPSEAPPPCVEA